MMHSEVNQISKPSRTKRIIQFPVTRIIIGLMFVVAALISVNVPMMMVGRIISGTEKPPEVWLMLMFLLMTGMVTLSYYLYVRWVEKRPLSEFSKSGALKEVGLGTAIGFGLMVIIILILWLLGYYRVVAVSSVLVLLLPLFECIFVGFFEEIAFRGIIFRIINKSLGSWLAILISSFLFGFAHSGNPNASLFSSIAISLEAGVLLCAAFLFTRRLWMVIGMHFAWNFTLGGIFGVTVSGQEVKGLLQPQLNGPEIFTGGTFGVEMSIVTVIICLLAGIYFLWKAWEKGHISPPFWHRPKELKSVSEV